MVTDELVTAIEVQVKSIEEAHRLINRGKLSGGFARLTLAAHALKLLAAELRDETA